MFDLDYCQEASSFYAYLLKHDYEILLEGTARQPSRDSTIFWVNDETGEWLVMTLTGDDGCVRMFGIDALKS